jgi:hypothetical protein
MNDSPRGWHPDQPSLPDSPGRLASEPGAHIQRPASFFESRSSLDTSASAYAARSGWKAARRIPLVPIERQSFIDWMFSDPVILSFSGIALLMILYQLALMILRPALVNISTSTDWLRACLAWLELIPVYLAAQSLSRFRRPTALAWWMFALAMLSYAVAQSLWSIYDQIIFPGSVPFPFWDDLFYLLQYPFFFFALTLLPGAARRGQSRLSRAKVVLDSLLLMAAGTALSWYFLLAPLYNSSTQSGWGKATNLAYPVGDLGLLFGLAVVVTRPGFRDAGRIALRILIASVIALILADSWYAALNLYSTYTAGDVPDIFWIVCYLLFAFAGLVQWRLAQQEGALGRFLSASQRASNREKSTAQVVGTFRLLLPFIAALVASALIVTRAAVAPIGTSDLLVPFGVSVALVVLVLVRQGITVLENERLLGMEHRRAEELAVAHQVAEDQRQLLAERAERLAHDIDHLKEVHARFASGDHTARAQIEAGELLPISGSLNLMLDRLSNLNQANIEYTRLEHAMQLVIEIAQGLAMGDEQALSALPALTNTPLDVVVLALGQLRTRLFNLSFGLRQLDLARRAARELTELAIQQGQFITAEGKVLGKMTEELEGIAKEIERAAQLLERLFSAFAPTNRPMAQVAGLLQLVERTARQQVTTFEAQIGRLAQAEGRANKAASEGRWLAAELDTAARTGGSRLAMSIPGMAEVPTAAPEASPDLSASAPIQRSSGDGSMAGVPEGAG